MEKIIMSLLIFYGNILFALIKVKISFNIKLYKMCYKSSESVLFQLNYFTQSFDFVLIAVMDE